MRLKYTFWVGIGRVTTVTVAADAYDQAVMRARSALDARYEKQGRGGEIPVGWDLELKRAIPATRARTRA